MMRVWHSAFPRRHQRWRREKLPYRSVLCQVAEVGANLIDKGTEALLEMAVWLARHLELHRSHLYDRLAHGLVDGVPANLVVTRALRNCLLGGVVEMNDHLHHANGLRQGAHKIVIAEAVLLEEVLADNLRALQSAFLILGQGILPDELHDFLQVILSLQDVLHLLLQEAPM